MPLRENDPALGLVNDNEAFRRGESLNEPFRSEESLLGRLLD
jgi:hypothetical protein